MNLLQQAVACLQTELPKGSTLIVFGSWARGEARPDSDVDLLVIEPEGTDRGCPSFSAVASYRQTSS